MKLSALDQALRASPRDPVLWLRLGDGLQERGRHHQAEEAYRRAAVLRPHCLLARLKLKRLNTRSPALRSLFTTTTAESLWGNGWLDPAWEDEGAANSTAPSRDTEAERDARGPRDRRVAHVRPTSVTQEIRIEGLELVGTAATATAVILIGYDAWTLYHTIIGGALLLLTTRHLPADALLRRQAPLGVAGVVGLCVLLIVAAPLGMLALPLGPIPAHDPLALPLWLLCVWLVATGSVALALRR